MTAYMLMSLIYLMNLKSLILEKISSLKFQRTRLPRGPFVLKVPPNCFTFCISKNEGIPWGSCGSDCMPSLPRAWVPPLVRWIMSGLNHVWLFATPWTAACQTSLSFTISRSLLKLMSIELMMTSNHLILCCPPSPPACNLSRHQGLFQEVSSSIRWPKYWRFIFSISSANEYSGLISFKVDWFDLLVVQETFESLL